MPVKLDKIAMIENLIKIDNKESMVVPMKLNKLQKHYMLNKTNRNIILKHRQGGCSSVVLADQFTDCILIPHTQCVVISHEGKATERLLDRVDFFYKGMSNPKPVLSADSRTEKKFVDLHSSIYIGTAGSRAFGRGDTIHKALLSELPWYEDGERILCGIEDAIPLTGELTIEATPNGEDNLFFEQWTRAREGKSPYKPFFFPWWWTKDYAIPRDSPYALPEDKGELTYTKEEQDLVDQYHLSEDQIRWRRWKIAEKQGLFWQEYPEDEVSCFITVGDPVFDNGILTTLAQGCYDGERHPDGYTVWIKPESNRSYWVGADSAAGAPTGSFSAAVVVDDLWRVCATFQARISPESFAPILLSMGKFYHNAIIGVERNFTGYAVLSHMTKYPNLYHQRDFVTGKVTSNIGWWTNDQTRGHLFACGKRQLPVTKLWNINLVRQLRGYRFIKLKPTPQTFDDLAIAFLIAIAIRDVGGVAHGYQGNVPGWDWS
jgi:hypothetical protein